MKNKRIQTGQALVMLLVFMIMAITITSAAVTIIIVNSQGTTVLEQGNDTLSIAESGAEDALLQTLRNPSYAGETLTVGDGTVIVVVVGINPKVITSQATANGYTRTVQVSATQVNGVWRLTNWKEMF